MSTGLVTVSESVSKDTLMCVEHNLVFYLQVFWLTLNSAIVIFMLIAVVAVVFWVIVLRLVLLTFMHRCEDGSRVKQDVEQEM